MTNFILKLITSLLLALALFSCGGGGSQSESLLLAPEVAMSAPYAIVPFTDTGGLAGTSTERLVFRVVFEDFFKCVPNGHAGVMLRASLEQIPSAQYRGVGVAFGRFGTDSYTTRNMPNLQPVAVVETWAVGASPDTFDAMLTPTLSPELHDWTPYYWTIDSTPTAAGNLIRYSIDGAFDSGPVLDINPAIDMTRRSLAFFNATPAGVETCPYTIRITDPTVTWTP